MNDDISTIESIEFVIQARVRKVQELGYSNNVWNLIVRNRLNMF